jgi:hypothetical protein
VDFEKAAPANCTRKSEPTILGTLLAARQGRRIIVISEKRLSEGLVSRKKKRKREQDEEEDLLAHDVVIRWQMYICALQESPFV